MNDLCVDIGYKSINHVGEQLCGDHVDIVDQGDDSQVIVLADGLGSGGCYFIKEGGNIKGCHDDRRQ